MALKRQDKNSDEIQIVVRRMSKRSYFLRGTPFSNIVANTIIMLSGISG